MYQHLTFKKRFLACFLAYLIGLILLVPAFLVLLVWDLAEVLR